MYTKDSKIKKDKKVRFEFKIIITINEDRDYILTLDTIEEIVLFCDSKIKFYTKKITFENTHIKQLIELHQNIYIN